MSNAETARNILVIEDDPDLTALLRLHLSTLPASVHCEADGRAGLRMALARPDWDAVVLDLQLPGLDGLTLCRELRQQGMNMPILMLTARVTELDRVLGLETGADDYLTKPFSVLELQARLRALWRRVHPAAARAPGPSAVAQGALRMDQRQRRAWLRDAELALTPREFDLLWLFAAEPGRAFSRDELLSQVWGHGYDGYDHTVNSHINRLRHKLGEGFIQTVWGRGYRFEPSC